MITAASAAARTRRRAGAAAVAGAGVGAAAASALLLLLLGALAPCALGQGYRMQQVRTENAAVILAAVPGTDRYVVSSREAIRWRTLVGTIDLATQRAVSFQSEDNHFCAGVAVTGDGRVIIMGGERETNGMQDGRHSIAAVTFPPPGAGGMPVLRRVAEMIYPRWYPTPTRIDDDRYLIVGGTEEADAGPTPPYAEIWNAGAEDGWTDRVPLPPAFRTCMGRNYFPFIHMLPNGNIVWWGSRCGSITANEDGNWQELRRLPALPTNFPFGTMYPNTATISPLAFRPQDNYAGGMVIFGGGALDFGVASDMSMRLDFTPCNGPSGYCFGGFTNEDIGIPLLMALSTLLPNGKIVLNGGAGTGFAALVNPENGYNYAGTPNLKALIYDPYAPAGRRYREFATTNVMRLYHSTACLHRTGEIVVAGCETCSGYVSGARWGSVDPPEDAPYEHRVELLVPPFIAPGVARPAINGPIRPIKRGSTFTVKYKYAVRNGITGASLAAPCADTHSINLNQRIIMLEVVTVKAKQVTFRAPPANMPALAPAGDYLFFLLGQDDTYSVGQWVKLTA